MQTQFGTGLIGRDIVAESNQVEIPASGKGKLTCDVGGSGGAGKLTLLDDAGRTIATADLGALKPGRQTITLPGGLPPGVHHVKIEVAGAGDSHPTVTTYLTGAVDGIEFGGSEVGLKVGKITVGLSSLLEIRPVQP